MSLNRHTRRALLKEQHQEVRQLPKRLTLIEPADYPPGVELPIRAWKSRDYLVQLWDESAMQEGVLRLSVCRTKMMGSGRWQDGLTWDELQQIKREVGYGDRYAVEVYPQDWQVVNVANMRHLWLLPEPLRIGWFASTTAG